MDFEGYPVYTMVQGVIRGFSVPCMGDSRLDGSVVYAELEDDNGSPVKLAVSPVTFVVDHETLEVGSRCMFWYRTDAPAPMIYPPQYNAVVAAVAREDRNIDVSCYDAELVNAEHTLQLNLDGSVELRTTNGQIFRGDPREKNLAVIYGTTTRSIPAQTTPKEVVVLYECMLCAD